MKSRIFLSFAVMIFCTAVMAQNSLEYKNVFQPKKYNNELKFNLVYAVAAMPELTYERIIEDNMALGVSASVSIDAYEDNDFRYSVLPYYRLYFGKKKAAGFFIEGNMGMIGTKEPIYIYSENYIYNTAEYKSYLNFGCGVATGVKLFTRNNYFGEVYGGVVRLIGQSQLGAYPRCGITLGKRF